MCNGVCKGSGNGTCDGSGGCEKAASPAPKVWAGNWAPMPRGTLNAYFTRQDEHGVHEIRCEYSDDEVLVAGNRYPAIAVRARAAEVLGGDSQFVRDLDNEIVERFIRAYTDMAHVVHAHWVRDIGAEEAAFLAVDVATLPDALQPIVRKHQEHLRNPGADVDVKDLFSCGLVSCMMRDVASPDQPVVSLLRALIATDEVVDG